MHEPYRENNVVLGIYIAMYIANITTYIMQRILSTTIYIYIYIYIYVYTSVLLLSEYNYYYMYIFMIKIATYVCTIKPTTIYYNYNDTCTRKALIKESSQCMQISLKHSSVFLSGS